MPFPTRRPVHFRSPARVVTIGAVVGVSWVVVAGCSSPSRGPEGDIVEVERIEVLPTETEAAGASAESGDTPPASDGGQTPSAESGAATVPPVEEVPAAPAAN